MTQNSQWFFDLAQQIDFDAIDTDNLRTFRSFMVKFASGNIPLKSDDGQVKAKKQQKLKNLARLAKWV